MLVLIAMYVISLNSRRQNFHKGALVGEESFTHTFRIPNYSWSTLEIGDVAASCGCTVVADLPKFVAPFRSLRVPVHINLAGRSGSFKSNVSIAIKNAGAIDLTLTAEIYPALPDVIDLGSVEKGATIEKKFAAPASLTEKNFVDMTGPITFELGLMDRQPIVDLKYTVSNPGGSFEIALLQSPVPVTIRGYVLRDVESRTPSISLGYLRPDSGTENEVMHSARFYSPYGKEFQWRPDQTQKSEFVELREVASDAELTISTHLRTPPNRGVYRETITFGFETSGNPEIVYVPVELHAYVLAMSQ